MKKTILIFGLISGFVSSGMMFANMFLLHGVDHAGGGLVRWLHRHCPVVSHGLLRRPLLPRPSLRRRHHLRPRLHRRYRHHAPISCVFYVVTWEILYFNFLHGFMDSYFAALIQKAQSTPGTPEAIQAKVAGIRHSQQLYEKPFFNVLYTFIRAVSRWPRHDPGLRRPAAQERNSPSRRSPKRQLKSRE